MIVTGDLPSEPLIMPLSRYGAKLGGKCGIARARRCLPRRPRRAPFDFEGRHRSIVCADAGAFCTSQRFTGKTATRHTLHNYGSSVDMPLAERVFRRRLRLLAPPWRPRSTTCLKVSTARAVTNGRAEEGALFAAFLQSLLRVQKAPRRLHCFGNCLNAGLLQHKSALNPFQTTLVPIRRWSEKLGWSGWGNPNQEPCIAYTRQPASPPTALHVILGRNIGPFWCIAPSCAFSNSALQKLMRCWASTHMHSKIFNVIALKFLKRREG